MSLRYRSDKFTPKAFVSHHAAAKMVAKVRSAYPELRRADPTNTEPRGICHFEKPEGDTDHVA